NTTICSNDLLYVPDLTKDRRFKDLPIVVGEPYLRFYCGMPLINRDGYALGTLCVVDFEAHEISSSQREAIRSLAQQAVAQLELRRQLWSGMCCFASSPRPRPLPKQRASDPTSFCGTPCRRRSRRR